MNIAFLLIATAALLMSSGIVLATRTLFPYHRVLATFFYLGSFIPLFLAVIERKHWIAQHKELVNGFVSRYGLYLAFAIVLLVVAYLAIILVPKDTEQIASLSPEELTGQQKQDLKTLAYLDAEFSDAVTQLGAIARTIDADKALLTSEQKKRIQAQWRRMNAISFELDLLRRRHRGFHYVDVLSQPEEHSRSFLIAYGAFTSQYRNTTALVAQTSQTDVMRKFLNQPDEEAGIKEHTYFTLKQQLTSPKAFIRLQAGKAYLGIVTQYLTAEEDTVSATKESIHAVESQLGKQADVLVKNPLDFFETKAFQAWFPVQKRAALQLSYVRTATRAYFITPEQIQQYQASFIPGDIFLERREWNSTNIGIPGFWTHAALYLGTREALDAHFRDLPVLNGQTFSTVLKETFPDVYAAMERKDEWGFLPAVIEAKRPGVILTSLEYTADADSIAVLRPRISLQEQYDAVMAALSYYGKPYDFNFDFLTDDAFVCSEVVYKSFTPLTSITFETEVLNGRALLSPNSFAQKYDQEYGKPSQQLDLVLFLDGNEKKRRAFERDEAAFRTTWKRPKWHVVEEYIKDSVHWDA